LDGFLGESSFFGCYWSFWSFSLLSSVFGGSILFSSSLANFWKYSFFVFQLIDSVFNVVREERGTDFNTVEVFQDLYLMV